MKKTTKKTATARDLAEATEAEHIGKKLPRGSSSLPKEVALEAQKKRILYATALVVAKKGYVVSTVGDIIKEAGVSRTTFYELFADKEDCFLDGFRTLAGAHLRAVRNAIKPDDHLADRGVKALKAYVERIDVDRDFSIAFVAEAESASPAVREAFLEVQGELAKMLRAWLGAVQAVYPDVEDCSETTFMMLLGGIQSFISFRARYGAAAQGASIQPLLVFTFATLGLYGWAKRARTEGAVRWGSPVR